MKRLFLVLWFVVLLILSACGGGGSSDKTDSVAPVIKTFSGKIEKGALQKGATITASEWSVSGGISGKVYTTETINDLGGYSISSTEIQGLLDVRADGFFINENTNTVENTRIILSGLADSSQSGANINIITHIIKQRVINLMLTGKDFSTANNQAVSELYATLNWTPENPLNTSISQNARLLFLSSAICKNRSVSEVSALLTDLVNDMADGTIDISVLDDSFSLVNTDEISANITSLYGICPDIASVKTQVIAYRNIEDETIRQITMIPVTTADFYVYGTSGLKGFVANKLEGLNISYVQKYLGVTETVNTIVNDFFSITEEGVKTLYFSVTFSYDSSTKLYKQVGGVMTEIASLPSKPAVQDIVYEDATYWIHKINGEDNLRDTEVWSKTSEVGACRYGEDVTGFYIADHFIDGGTDKGSGIFMMWSGGTGNWMSEDYSTPIVNISGGRMW